MLEGKKKRLAVKKGKILAMYNLEKLQIIKNEYSRVHTEVCKE